MKKIFLFLFLFLLPAAALAEKATYDLVRYTPPAPWKKTAWKKEVKDKNNVTYTSTDKSNGTYCQIGIINSTTSKGDIDADFDSEWKGLIVPYGVTEPAQTTDAAEEDGWKVKAGIGTFAFAKGTSIAVLTTISGYGRTVSIVGVTSSQDYIPAIQELLRSVEMKQPAGGTAAASGTGTATAKAKPAATGAAKPTALQGYMEYSPFTKTWTWRLRTPQQ
jgi:hypothetical protein